MFIDSPKSKLRLQRSRMLLQTAHIALRWSASRRCCRGYKHLVPPGPSIFKPHTLLPHYQTESSLLRMKLKTRI